MYRTLRHGESSLQYRIVPGTIVHRRTKKSSIRVIWLVVAGLVAGCLIIAGAVVVPAVLAASLVALPPLASSTRAVAFHTPQGPRYIAILPRETRLRILSLNDTKTWHTISIWKELDARKLWLPIVVAVALIFLVVAAILLLRKIHKITRRHRILDSEYGDDLLYSDDDD